MRPSATEVWGVLRASGKMNSVCYMLDLCVYSDDTRFVNWACMRIFCVVRRLHACMQDKYNVLFPIYCSWMLKWPWESERVSVGELGGVHIYLWVRERFARVCLYLHLHLYILTCAHMHECKTSACVKPEFRMHVCSICSVCSECKTSA